MFLVCFFSFLLSTLTVATVATALPATANPRAMIATTMAGEGTLRLTLPIWTSSSDPVPLCAVGLILCRRSDRGQPEHCFPCKALLLFVQSSTQEVVGSPDPARIIPLEGPEPSDRGTGE